MTKALADKDLGFAAIGRCNIIRYVEDESNEEHIAALTYTFKYSAPVRWNFEMYRSTCVQGGEQIDRDEETTSAQIDGDEDGGSADVTGNEAEAGEEAVGSLGLDGLFRTAREQSAEVRADGNTPDATPLRPEQHMFVGSVTGVCFVKSGYNTHFAPSR